MIGLLILVSAIGSAQQKTISGVVKNAEGDPVPKASVLLKESNKGTTTDEKGAFTIEAATGETLIFSAVGFASMEVKVGANNNVNVTLAGESKALEEVVVTALGIKREKKSL